MGSDISKVTFTHGAHVSPFDSKVRRREEEMPQSQQDQRQNRKDQKDQKDENLLSYSDEQIAEFVSAINCSELYQKNGLIMKHRSGDHFVSIFSSDGRLIKEIFVFQVKKFYDQLNAKDSHRGRLLDVSC